MTRWCIIAAAIGFSFGLPSAWAGDEAVEEVDGGDREKAKRLFAEANERLKAEDFRGAIERYRRAHGIYPHALIRYNLGIAHHRRGDPVSALRTMRLALEAEPRLNERREKRAREIVAESLRKVVVMRVRTNVEGVDVRVQGNLVGRTPEVEFPVAAGEPVQIEARKEGFVPRLQVVRATAGSTQELVLQLDVATALPAQVRVETQLPGAEVVVDGMVVGITPLQGSVPVSADHRHRIELRRAGYVTAVETIELGPGADATVALDPRVEVDAPTTTVEIDVMPRDASVRIDGRMVTTRHARLVAGLHRVVIERSGYEPASYDLLVPVDQAPKMSFSLMPTPQTRQAMVDHAEGIQWWGTGLAVGGSVVGAAGLALLIYNEGYGYDVALRDFEQYDTRACTNEAPGFESEKEACMDGYADVIDAKNRAKALRVVAPVVASLGIATATAGLVMVATGDDPAAFRLDGGDALAGVTFTPLVTVSDAGGYIGLRADF